MKCIAYNFQKGKGEKNVKKTIIIFSILFLAIGILAQTFDNALLFVTWEAKKLGNGGGYFESGNTLYEKMISGNSFNESYAMGFIMGICDAYNGAFFLLRREVTVRQICDIVKSFLRENPQSRHLSASTLVCSALMRDFPLEKKD
jgi:hypothetical protein